MFLNYFGLKVSSSVPFNHSEEKLRIVNKNTNQQFSSVYFAVRGLFAAGNLTVA